MLYVASLPHLAVICSAVAASGRCTYTQKAAGHGSALLQAFHWGISQHSSAVIRLRTQIGRIEGPQSGSVGAYCNASCMGCSWCCNSGWSWLTLLYSSCCQQYTSHHLPCCCRRQRRCSVISLSALKVWAMMGPLIIMMTCRPEWSSP